ncbi:type I-E CRISPR-associated protein Cse2/CasB [Actinosynnema sp. CS-041913]|uniref:type I-E CRISPR-associated protein Cse2/CasB n=1 Tax=Actinosynnema sp. CS-041913 TaxID=3239917 RepID=UPI003D8A33E4
MTAVEETRKAAPAQPRWKELTAVGTEVHKRIVSLQARVIADESTAVATLAKLRRGVGKPAGSVNEILQYTVSEVFAGPDADDGPTAAETAAHIALTLYALHQQSHRTRVHLRGYGLGRSVRLLLPEEPQTTLSPVARRFLTLGTSQSLDELVHHLRGMVQLLRAKPVPLDYGLLADELTRWPQPDSANRIRLRWGRDFHRTTHPTDSTTDDH